MLKNNTIWSFLLLCTVLCFLFILLYSGGVWIAFSTLVLCICVYQWVLYTVHETYKSLFSVKFLLKIVPTVLFIYLKIILLQCFQFSVINGIQITHNITSVFLFYTKRKVSGVRIEVEALQQYFKYSKMIACISTLLATKRKRKKQRKGLGGGGQCRA